MYLSLSQFNATGRIKLLNVSQKQNVSATGKIMQKKNGTKFISYTSLRFMFSIHYFLYCDIISVSDSMEGTSNLLL